MQDWYGAKTVYYLEKNSVASEGRLYEERIIVLQATSFDHAIAEAEKEAHDYADVNSGLKYLGYVNVFKLFDDAITDKTEVYSLIRESKLSENDYLNIFFDIGSEITKKI